MQSSGFSRCSVTDWKQVEYIEQDAIVTIAEYVTQSDVPWGLARISHREKGHTTYVYDETAGEGTCAYIIDTGIYVEHEVFRFPFSISPHSLHATNSHSNLAAARPSSPTSSTLPRPTGTATART